MYGPFRDPNYVQMIIDERPKLANYKSPKDCTQDRCFLAVQVKGVPEVSVEEALWTVTETLGAGA